MLYMSILAMYEYIRGVYLLYMWCIFATYEYIYEYICGVSLLYMSILAMYEYIRGVYLLYMWSIFAMYEYIYEYICYI